MIGEFYIEYGGGGTEPRDPLPSFNREKQRIPNYREILRNGKESDLSLDMAMKTYGSKYQIRLFPRGWPGTRSARALYVAPIQVGSHNHCRVRESGRGGSTIQGEGATSRSRAKWWRVGPVGRPQSFRNPIPDVIQISSATSEEIEGKNRE